jgi:hypothetical protein
MNRDRIPTALSPREVDCLQAFCRTMRVVEAGALLGYSTLAIAAVAHSVISIDRHRGYGPTTWGAYRSNIEGIPNIIPVRADAARVLGAFTADRYFLDLDGTLPTMRAVLDAIPYHVPVAVHDCCRSGCDGVEEALRELDYDVTAHVDSLVIARRR